MVIAFGLSSCLPRTRPSLTSILGKYQGRGRPTGRQQKYWGDCPRWANGNSPGDAVVVHMADTLLDIEGVPIGDAVYVQSRSDLYRWTSVSVDSAGCIRIINDRNEIEPCGPRPVCVGLFSFEDGDRLAAVLASAVEHGSPGREPFFVALENYSSSRPMDLRPIQRWMDCGHVDGYYESRLSYQNLRHFNTLSYDPVEGGLRKSR